MIDLNTYSFLDTRCSITGPGGSFQLAQDAGVAEEGISFEMLEDKGGLTVGASGDAMHTLYAGHAGRATVRLLKTSPVNGMLSAMYDFQRLSSLTWGKNVLLCNTPNGDVITGRMGAFTRWPNLGYAKNAQIVEWAWVFARLDGILGRGA